MAEATLSPSRTPPWRNPRVLRWAGQALFVLVLVIAVRALAVNLTDNLNRQGHDLSFRFLQTRAGFDIGEGIAFSPNESMLKAYIVGVVNTLRVAVVGIVLASGLGLIIGVARLSPNWLVRKLAQIYVEAIRNTPVFVQIVFWASFLLLTLPLIQNSFRIGRFALFNVRAVAVAWPHGEGGAGMWAAVLLGGLVAAVFVFRWRTRLFERTGVEAHRLLWSAGVFLAIAVVGFFATGTPLKLDTPAVVGHQVEGGVRLTLPYAALLLGLVVYTAAFIAEIVRGSILAVPKGQKEAAAAIGLSPAGQLRLVVLPQALRVALPAINNQYLNLTKNTSLGLAIGFPDLMAIARTIANQTAAATQILLVAMSTYLVMSLFISTGMNVLNRVVALRGESR